MDSNENLINYLIESGWLKTPAIINAFRKINRDEFVLEDFKSRAYINEPLSIGYDQTISQPLTVAFMLELLQARENDKILEIGSGSGWQTALLAELTGKNGKVYALEIIPELSRFGKSNIEKFGYIKSGQVDWLCQDGSKGLTGKSPFNKIIAAASAGQLPQDWIKQLEIGGRLVAPVKNSVWLIIRENKDEFEKQEFPGFAFVPLKNNHEK